MGFGFYDLVMLGEQHNIDHEFPEYHDKLVALRAEDEGFDAMVSEHDELDDRIRRLEEKQQPISDEEMEKMKFHRAALKDRIYQRLLS